MRAVAFDFDGVLCDSSREVFVVAVDTYAGMEPGCGILGRLRSLRDDALGGGEGFRDHPLYRGFLDLLPLGNRAEDFGVALAALDHDAAIADQAAYDAFFSTFDARWLERFHARFYQQRGTLRRADEAAWIDLHLPYPGLAEVVDRRRGRAHLAVATAKDRRSVELLLGSLGFGDLFERRLILDKETGVSKTEHLRVLHERAKLEFEHITFIDDKVNHLCTVAALGVRPVLAGWGFNTPREHRVAADRGFEIASLEDAGEVLFQGV